MFFFSRFSMHTDIPQKNLRVGCTHSLSIRRRASNKLKGKRRNCCLFLSPSLYPFLSIGCPATRLCLVTTTAYIYVITSPAWLLRPLAKWEENKWHSSILCVRVAIMDNKSLAAIVCRSPPSRSRISQPTNIYTLAALHTELCVSDGIAS